MWQKNLDVLKNQYPNIYELVSASEDEGRFEFDNEGTSIPNIKYEGKHFNSRYNPKLEARRWVDTLEIDESYDGLFVYGLGLGYHLSELKAKYNNKKIIIVEPHIEIFKYCMTCQDITPYLEDEFIVFLVALEAFQVRNLLEYYIEESKIERVYFTELPFYKKHFSEYISEVYDQISRTLELFRANIYTEIFSSRRWLYNFFSNIKYFETTPNIISLDGAFKGSPVIIVAAGPSLNKNIHLLRKVYNKALIIAVGTAALILDRQGIKPHIIMGADGNIHESEIFRNIRSQEPLFIYSNMIHYKSLEYYKGKKMWVHLQSDELETQFLNSKEIRVPSITSGGSIAHNALAFARWLEAGHIMLLGQDLAFSNEKMYADGGNNDNVTTSASYVDTEDIYGHPIKTNRVFLTYRNWFEDFISLVYKEHKVVNCTEGGIAIAGIENMPFEKAIYQFCTEYFNYEEQLSNCYNKDVGFFKLENNLFQSLKAELEICYQLAKLRVEKVEEWIESNDVCEAKAIQSKVMELTDTLEEKYFYKTFILNTGKMFSDAMTREVSQKIKGLKTDEARKEAIIGGLYSQYIFALENLRIAQAAFEGIEPANLF